MISAFGDVWAHASLCLLIAGSVLCLPAQTGAQIYPIFELTDAQLAELDFNDGSLDDWEQLLAGTELTQDHWNGGRVRTVGRSGTVPPPG